ncbi:MAG: class A beta-lactamase [Polyangiaceae bacterium]
MTKRQGMTVRRRSVLQAGGALFLGGCAEMVTRAPPPPAARAPVPPAAGATAPPAASAAGPATTTGEPALPPPQRSQRALQRDLAMAEAEVRAVAARIGGRLGLHAVDTENDNHISLDADARYATASTFKALLAAAVLARVEAGKLTLEQRIPISRADVQEHAPVIKARLGDKALSVRDLCAAIVEVSDNGAANVLLRQVDGPAGLTAFLRGIGDAVTRVDRFEPALNSNRPGDERDTTSPRAMVQSIRRVCLGDALQPASRKLLVDWMVNAQTGMRRIRAGLPDGWRAADKTGTGMRLAVNDVAIAWPPGGKPVVMAIYTSDSTLKLVDGEQAHAEVACNVACHVAPQRGSGSGGDPAGRLAGRESAKTERFRRRVRCRHGTLVAERCLRWPASDVSGFEGLATLVPTPARGLERGEGAGP